MNSSQRWARARFDDSMVRWTDLSEWEQERMCAAFSETPELLPLLGREVAVCALARALEHLACTAKTILAEHARDEGTVRRSGE